MDKLRALQYFVAAAEEERLSGAARRLEVSVPAVAKLITALERSLGARLDVQGYARVTDEQVRGADVFIALGWPTATGLV